MKASERLITDLEEEILFRLSLQKTALPLLTIVECVSQHMNRYVSLGRTHEVLEKLEASGFTYAVSSKTKKKYKITTAGIAALQADWIQYSRNLYGS
jgi:hypothetical protein